MVMKQHFMIDAVFLTPVPTKHRKVFGKLGKLLRVTCLRSKLRLR